MIYLNKKYRLLKYLTLILQGELDANISFEDLCNLLKKYEFIERIREVIIFLERDGIIEKINLQRDGSKAKAYQVRQVREIILIIIYVIKRF